MSSYNARSSTRHRHTDGVRPSYALIPPTLLLQQPTPSLLEPCRLLAQSMRTASTWSCHVSHHRPKSNKLTRSSRPATVIATPDASLLGNLYMWLPLTKTHLGCLKERRGEFLGTWQQGYMHGGRQKLWDRRRRRNRARRPATSSDKLW